MMGLQGEVERIRRDALVLRQWKDGATTGEIAERVGASRQTISRVLRQAGVPADERWARSYEKRVVPDVEDDVRRAWAEGWSIRRIGDNYHVTAGRVRKILLEEGVPASELAKPRRKKFGPEVETAGMRRCVRCEIILERCGVGEHPAEWDGEGVCWMCQEESLVIGVAPLDGGDALVEEGE